MPHTDEGLLSWMRTAAEAAERLTPGSDAGIPFLFKQSSDLYTERGIDGLSRFIAWWEGRQYDPAQALIRQYPATVPPLLPFTEHGHRYSDQQWTKLVADYGAEL
jgi:hypothetical protein